MNRREFLQLATKTVGVVAVAAMLPQTPVMTEWPMVAGADAVVDGGHIHDLEFNNMTLTFADNVIVENCIFNNCQIDLVGSSDERRVWFINNLMRGSHVAVHDYAIIAGGYADVTPVETSLVGVRLLGDYDEYTPA